MRSVWIIARKDLRLLRRDPMALFWVFVFPLAFGLFIGAVLQAVLDDDPQVVRLDVVDESDTAASRRLIAALMTEPALEVRRTDAVLAEARVRGGEAAAYLRIPEGFGEGPARAPGVELGVDPVRTVEARLVERLLLTQIASSFEASPVSASPQASAQVRRRIIGSAAVQRSGFDVALPSAVLWGLIGCAAAFAVAFVSERSAGTLTRLWVAPLGPARLLGGKALACFIACVTDALLLTALAWLLLDVRISNVPLMLLAVASCAICFVGITALLGVLGKSEQAVAGAGWSTLIVMAMLGGGMVPLSFMPGWLVRVSDLSPVKWGILALEGAAWRGLDLAQLAGPCAVLLGVGAAGFLAGLWRLTRFEVR